MIRLHEFNTGWWGEPAGIVDDAAFFALPPEAQRELLAPFRWAEFKSRLQGAPPSGALQRAGFFLSDVQVEFRIGLKAGAHNPCSQALQVRFADEHPFELRDGDFASFEHERYRHLPGFSEQRINSRYGKWGRQLIRDYPETCLEVLADGVPQGWFLSRPAANGLNLALAMKHRDAKISGFLVYQRGLEAYAARGHAIGWASFSVTNTAVHNIYAKLGAHFVAPAGNWLWIGSL